MPRHASIMYKHPFTQSYTRTHLKQCCSHHLRLFSETWKTQTQQILKHNKILGKDRGRILERAESLGSALCSCGAPIRSPLPGWLSCCPSVTEPDNHNNLFVLNLRSRSRPVTQTQTQSQQVQTTCTEPSILIRIPTVLHQQCLSLVSCKLQFLYFPFNRWAITSSAGSNTFSL